MFSWMRNGLIPLSNWTSSKTQSRLSLKRKTSQWVSKKPTEGKKLLKILLALKKKCLQRLYRFGFLLIWWRDLSSSQILQTSQRCGLSLTSPSSKCLSTCCLWLVSANLTEATSCWTKSCRCFCPSFWATTLTPSQCCCTCGRITRHSWSEEYANFADMIKE